MKKNRIKTLAGDGVTIEMSPYYRRRLIFRHKDDERAGVSRSLVRRPFVRAVLVDFKRRKDHTHAHLHLAGDLGGSKVPQQHGPWTAIGVVRSETAPPHKFSRVSIERAIDGEGFQLWRLSGKAEPAA